MKKTLTKTETVAVASMLFGMFFGAGNLIYPIVVGQMAGQNILPATIGFLISAVGIPILAVAAFGISRSESFFLMGCKVDKAFGYFFACALYLTIGPLFAIPRCATVPFEVGIKPLVGEERSPLALAVYSLVFFAVVLFFSLKPGKLMTTIGKVLTPVFLVALSVLVIACVASPMGSVSNIAASGDYANSSLLSGFFKGYDTLDALAGLAFGIVVVDVIRRNGVEDPGAVAKNTMRSGVFAGLLMAVIYAAIILVGGQSMNLLGEPSANGGEAFAVVSQHYFGVPGMIVLAIIFGLACLKTAIGLVTSCSEAFCQMFPKGLKYRDWAVVFSVVALLIANLGLNTITSYSAPVLYFLYPLAIVLILLAFASEWIGDRKPVYVCTMVFTFIAAICDFANVFSSCVPDVAQALRFDVVIDFAKEYLPLFSLGLGWIIPATIGCVIGLAVCLFKKVGKKV